jgi:hypothetical protein
MVTLLDEWPLVRDGEHFAISLSTITLITRPISIVLKFKSRFFSYNPHTTSAKVCLMGLSDFFPLHNNPTLIVRRTIAGGALFFSWNHLNENKH